MKQYKAIFLDWDDTIGDFRNAAFRSLQEIYTTFQLHNAFPSFEQFYDLYSVHNTWLWDQYGLNNVSKDYLEFDRFFYPLMHAPHPFSMQEASTLALQIYKLHLANTTNYFQPLPDAIEVVRYLAKKYPLTIVSNGFIEVQYTKIERSTLRDCFAHIILSEEVGVPKPNPRIFQIALERNQLQPSDVLMIGDSYNSDIQGAKNAGIDQLWLRPQDADPALSATYEVAHLRDIMQLL